MLRCQGDKGRQVREDQAAYTVDTDPDPEKRKSQQGDALDDHSSRQ